MRIVGGRLGGRRLRASIGAGTRPTAERVREAIASLLEARGAVAGAQVLELYAGTGALGFEMLSRGAARALFVEKDAAMARALAESARELELAGQVEVLRLDLTRPKAQREIAGRGPFSLVLADPPYREVEQALRALEALTGAGLLADDALLLLETSARSAAALPESFLLLSQYRYGDTAVHLFCSRAEVRASTLTRGGDER
jgi:16S rRNA (guanine966-N2)-methyltransferase